MFGEFYRCRVRGRYMYRLGLSQGSVCLLMPSITGLDQRDLLSMEELRSWGLGAESGVVLVMEVGASFDLLTKRSIRALRTSLEAMQRAHM